MQYQSEYGVNVLVYMYYIQYTALNPTHCKQCLQWYILAALCKQIKSDKTHTYLNMVKLITKIDDAFLMWQETHIYNLKVYVYLQ